jgi:hypothetical protein
MMQVCSAEECKRRWDKDGWFVYQRLIPLDVLEPAQRALHGLFPTADEFADYADPERIAPLLSEQGAPQPQFPFESDALNDLALNDLIIDLAQQLLAFDDIGLYQAAVAAKYSNGALNDEQDHHLDSPKDAGCLPRAIADDQHATMFIYLSDVTPDTAATRVLPREVTAGIPVERSHLPFDEFSQLYALEQSASGPAGSVFVYRRNVFHRGVAVTAPRSARFMLPVAFEPSVKIKRDSGAFDTGGQAGAWHRFTERATDRQLRMLGLRKQSGLALG